MLKFLEPILQVRRSEWPRAILAFFYFFLVITSLYILKPVRDALFIGQHGARNLPYAKLLTFAVLTALVWLMVRAVKYFQKQVYLSICVAFSVIMLIFFWWTAGGHYVWTGYAFYVWVGIYSVLNVTLFWTTANDLFTLREAKRLFGFIGSGGILGGIVGSDLTARLATVVGSRALLLVAAFVLLFCIIIIINWLWALQRDRMEGTAAAVIPETGEMKPRGATWRALLSVFRDRYLFIVLILIMLAKMVSSMIDYQFKNVVDAVPYLEKDMLTAFFGRFYNRANIFSLIVQFFFTSLILRKLGVITALLILPVGVAAGSLGIFVAPMLWITYATSAYDKGMNYSLNQTTKEILYLPVDRETRYRIKPVIDMVGFRAADAAGNLLVLLFASTFMLNVGQLSLISLALLAIWFITVVVMKGDYRDRLRSYLARGPVVEKGNLVGRSRVLLRCALLDTLGRNRREHQLLLLRALNLLYDPNTGEVFLERTKNHFDVQTLPALLETLREKKTFKDEVQDMLERGRVEEAGFHMEYLMQFRGRTAERIGIAMQQQSFATIRFAGLVAESLYGKTQHDFKNRAAKIVHAALEEDRIERKTIVEIVRQYAPDETGTSRFLELAGSLDRASLKPFLPMLTQEAWVVDALTACINDPRLGVELRYWMPLVLSMIPTERSRDALLGMLDHRNSTVRYRALKALNKLHASHPALELKSEILLNQIRETILRWEEAFKTLALYEGLKRLEGARAQQEDAFAAAQELRLDDLIERIFRLMGLVCDPEEAYRIYNALQQTDPQLRANAMELLEHSICPRIGRAILEILDRDLEGDLRAMGDLKSAAVTHTRSLLSIESRWNVSSAFTLILRFGLHGLDEDVRKLTQATDPLMRHMAQAVISELTPATPAA